LKDGDFLLHDRGAIRATDVTYDLLAATTKTQFVIGSLPSPLFAHEPLVSQTLEVAYL
jgi:hypothetical protein